MCLYANEITNPRYDREAAGKREVAEPWDYRLLTLRVPCGRCKECRSRKASEWRVRLLEELKENKGYMVTLTFSKEGLNSIIEKIKSDDSEAVAKYALKAFRERWRRKYKKSIRHFVVTELGHTKTERVHMHGILFTKVNIKEGHRNARGDRRNETTYGNGIKTGIRSTTCLLAKIWKYGMVHVGEYCTEKTIGYVIKYVTKEDEDHPGYAPKILTSPGMGKSYVETHKEKHKFKEGETNTKYKTNSGVEIELPQYYKRKILSDREREELMLKNRERETVWINGHEIKKEAIYEQVKAMAYNRLLKDPKGQHRPWEWAKKTYPARNAELNLED